jgi:transcription termination/antitermination protein NusA
MSSEIIQAIEQVGREKGIEVDVIIRAVEDAYAAASKKYYRTKEEIGARFNRENGSLEVFAKKKVVELVANPDLEISLKEAERLDPGANLESIVEIPKPTEGLGRIAAQAAKQIIFQKVREAERENVYKEYSARLGELINGVVKRFERGSIVVDLGKTEAVLPKKEQSKAEHYNQGDRIRAIIVDVDRNAKGPQIILSRTDPRLLIKLFEMEVPEIYDGTVKIEVAVRDAGDRAKIAVRSKDKDVDPVGACVGMKGSRVQSIIRELRGEKIDIVQYSTEISSFVTHALNPARINRVSILDLEGKVLEVVVDDDQLSLAIGKKGQNVRLASRLVGWRIDIKSEQDKKREVEMEMERMARANRPLESVEDLSVRAMQKLLESGLTTIGSVLALGLEGLTAIPSIGPKTAEKILLTLREVLDAPLPEEETEVEAAEETVEEAAIQADATPVGDETEKTEDVAQSAEEE